MIKFPTASERDAQMRKAEADVRTLTAERDELKTRIASALKSLNEFASYCLPWTDNAHARLIEAVRALDGDPS